MERARSSFLIASVDAAASEALGTILFDAGFAGRRVTSGADALAELDQSALELEVALKKAERRALERALERADGNKNVAARLLGISRRSLYYKLEEHGLLG